jgi:DNA repair protein RecN (Recombination protein N)
LLLAIKAAEKRNNQTPHSLLVFDEVDTGIGGQTAVEVGAKLKKLSESSQVIVITHLHQIARQADHHYQATKTGGRGQQRVTITVTRLDKTAIAAELDRMVALPD